MKRKQKTKICLTMIISLLTSLIVLCSCSLSLNNIEDIVSVAQKDTQTAEQDVTQAVIGEETLSFVNISDVTLIQKYIAASSNN